MAFRATVLVFVGVLLSQCTLFADVVYLQNGRAIEGTVLESNDEFIVLEMSMGSVTLDRSKILRIERNREGNLRRKAIAKEAEFSGDLSNLKRSLASLHSLRGKLSILRLRVQNEEATVHRLEDSLAELQKKRTIALQELEPYAQYRGRRVPGRVYDQYIAAQTKYENATAQIQTHEQELVTARRELAGAREVLGDSKSEILRKITELRHRRNELVSEGCPEALLDPIDRGLRGFEDINLSKQIPLRRQGNSFYIQVTLNDQVTEEFILDTGCSTILLTPDVANRLNLGAQMILGSGSSTIADGSTMEVQNVYLESVEVNGMRAGKVAAQVAISDDGNTPLLLGMSYLERFRFSLDAQRGILTLE